jgi:hypothetical protein
MEIPPKFSSTLEALFTKIEKLEEVVKSMQTEQLKQMKEVEICENICKRLDVIQRRQAFVYDKLHQLEQLLKEEEQYRQDMDSNIHVLRMMVDKTQKWYIPDPSFLKWRNRYPKVPDQPQKV